MLEFYHISVSVHSSKSCQDHWLMFLGSSCLPLLVNFASPAAPSVWFLSSRMWEQEEVVGSPFSHSSSLLKRKTLSLKHLPNMSSRLSRTVRCSWPEGRDMDQRSRWDFSLISGDVNCTFEGLWKKVDNFAWASPYAKLGLSLRTLIRHLQNWVLHEGSFF